MAAEKEKCLVPAYELLETYNGTYKGVEYNINKSKLLKCPYKTCKYDFLSFLGGKFAVHHCTKHGLFLIKLKEGIVTTDKKNGFQRTWRIDDLVAQGILEINLYQDDKLVYTTHKGE